MSINKDYCKRLIKLQKELGERYKIMFNHQKKHTNQSGFRVARKFLTKDSQKSLRLFTIWFKLSKKFGKKIRKITIKQLVNELLKFECDNIYFKAYYIPNKKIFKSYKDLYRSEARYKSQDDLYSQLTKTLITKD